MEPTNNVSGTCGCKHHKIVPAAVIVFGIVFLLGYLSVLSWGAVNIIWPILVIIAGIMKLTKGKCKCCQA